jgi:chromosome segregation ATPase
MAIRFMILLAFVSSLLSCTGEKEKLQTQVDSLKAELQTSQQFASTLQEVGTLMDSIDANRQLLKVNMVEGTTYDDYTARMKDINNYVKDTQEKIEDLEKALKKSKGSASTYAAMVTKLKSDLEVRNKEIATLQGQVEELKSSNQNLITTVGLQEAELSDKEAQIAAKQQELALIDAKIQEMMVQSKMSQGDSFFAQGQALEEAANRTKLAPKKKKETLKEALELYKKAQSLGNDKAQAKVDELTKRLK